MKDPEIAPTRVGGALEDLAAVFRGVSEEVAQAARRLLTSSPGGVPLDVPSGGIDLHAEAMLEIKQVFPAEFDLLLQGDPLTLWGGAGARARFIRGEPSRVTREGDRYALEWTRGALELRVPRTLALLLVRTGGSDVAIHGHEGPMQVDLAGGFLRVMGARAPFRVRAVQAPVVVTGCALAEGESMIHAAGGDVVLELHPAASLELEIRAAGGRIELPQEGASWRGRTAAGAVARARGTFGSGRGRLAINALGGWVRVRLAAPID